jgi:SAM-dependent methyltransferase
VGPGARRFARRARGTVAMSTIGPMESTEATAKHWDEYVTKHMVAGADSNRAEWMAHPVVQRYRRTMSGAVDEADWLVSGYLQGRPIERAIGIGAGHSVFELGLLGTGAVEAFDLYDLSAKALELAERSASSLGVSDRIATHVTDINTVDLEPKRYGLATFYSSLHHVVDLDGVVSRLAHALRDDGVLFAAEYIGPNRFEFGPAELELARAFFDALDPKLRYTWSPEPASWGQRLRGRPSDPVRPSLPVPDPAEIAAADPTEAVHSGEIVETLERYFGGVHVAPMGGALAYPLWAGLNHDYVFEDRDGVRFVETLVDLDQALTESGRLPTYFALIAASSPLRALDPSDAPQIRSGAPT